MILRMTGRVEVDSADGLTPHQLEQVRAAGRAYDGDDVPAAERLAETEYHEDGNFREFCERWDVVDVTDGSPAYEAWLYKVDSGTVFKAGTTEIVAEIVQCGLVCDDDELRMLLGAAMLEADTDYLIDPEQDAYQAVLTAQQGEART